MSGEKPGQYHQEHEDAQLRAVAPRDGSLSGETAIEDNNDFNRKVMVEAQRAKDIKPSRLSGRKLNWMVTFVAGTGVSRVCNLDAKWTPQSRADSSSRFSAMIKECTFSVMPVMPWPI